MADTSSDSIRILCVADENRHQADVAAALEQRDDRLVVETESRASIALDRVRDAEGDVECIVSDYQLDGQNGLVFLDAVRSIDPDVPFILYTNEGSESIASEAIGRGVTDYLQRETDDDQYEELCRRIDTVVADYRADRATARARHRYEKYLDHVSDIVFVIDASGTFTYLSPSVETVLGYSPDELHGENGFDYVHPDDVAAAADELGDVITDPDYTGTVEFRAIHTDGSWPVLDVRARNHLDDPQIDGILVVARDITDRKHAEEQLKAYTDTVTHLHDVATDITAAETKTEIYQRTADGAATLFPCDVARVAADEDDQLVPVASSRDEPVEEYEPCSLTVGFGAMIYRSEAPLRIDDLTDTRSASPADTPTSTEPSDTSGSPTTSRATHTDRTSTDEYRSLLGIPLGDYGIVHLLATDAGAFEESDEEVADLLAAHVTTGLDHIEAETTLRRERDRLEAFTSMLSHDLRNPLTVAQGRLDAARQTGDAAHFAAIERAQNRIERLIEDVLTLAHQGNTVSTVEAVPIESVAEEAWSNVAVDDATLTCRSCGRIEADHSQLLQVFENLYRNAVEHSDDPVTVTVGQLDDGFYLEDTGPGIPPAERDRIFDRDHSTSDEATGLGLTIVARIVDAHDWNVDVTTGTSGGARFEFSDVTRADT